LKTVKLGKCSEGLNMKTTPCSHQGDHIFSRRGFLGNVAHFCATGAATAWLLNLMSTEARAAGNQDQWWSCKKCGVLFYNGFPQKGRCAAGRAHVAEETHTAQGNNYLISYDVPESSNAQGGWRNCHKCQAMFFDGYPNKGACPAGGGHGAAGFVFVLAHDVPEKGLSQKEWRYCGKCHALFNNGTQNKGRCAAGGVHTPENFNFVLRYRGNIDSI
jgi:hypothetical protein